ncbi:hypothetical protein M0R45_001402 [Rubus argutus]|uniref:Uncharacterized protein n=1 Tax=Rubus argutus TaxID=59490 RepID=A0AAW1VK44_RUBAR
MGAAGMHLSAAELGLVAKSEPSMQTRWTRSDIEAKLRELTARLDGLDGFKQAKAIVTENRRGLAQMRTAVAGKNTAASDWQDHEHGLVGVSRFGCRGYDLRSTASVYVLWSGPSWVPPLKAARWLRCP